ncbi:hypothetical protein F4X90_13945 [Candidatus Poribacteria bacterium]|nr:hypothetical protein [Candidatus Poribacteria bacterium]
MSFDVERLRNQIPFYLTAKPEQKELLHNLESLIRGTNKGYYISAARDVSDDAVLQGDGRNGLQLYSFEDGKKHEVRGIVLSNTCDISTDNERVWVPRIIFAPIVKLSAIEARFKVHQLAEDAIKSRIKSIKNQSVTNIFYLPSGARLDEDHVVLLDDLHSMPAGKLSGEKLFTLSMAGFYLFSFKLSIHFCRLQENIDRRP